MENNIIKIDIISRKSQVKYETKLKIKTLDQVLYEKNIQIPLKDICYINEKKQIAPYPLSVIITNLKSNKSEELTCIFQLGTHSILKIIYDEESFLGTEAMAISESKNTNDFNIDKFVNELEIIDKKHNNNSKIHTSDIKNPPTRKNKKINKKNRVDNNDNNISYNREKKKNNLNTFKNNEELCDINVNKFEKLKINDKIANIYDILNDQSNTIKLMKEEIKELKLKLSAQNENNPKKIGKKWNKGLLINLINKFIACIMKKNNIFSENIDYNNEFNRIISFKDQNYDDFNKSFIYSISLIKENHFINFYDQLKNDKCNIDLEDYSTILNIILSYMNFNEK